MMTALASLAGFPRRFCRDGRGATAAEFAMVLPIVILFLLGIIDVGRYTWQLNQLEKGAQMGARMAVVTQTVDNGIATASYVGDTSCGTTLTAGDAICRGALGKVTCTSAGCSCATSPCPASSFQSSAFSAILARVQLAAPMVKSGNLAIDYSGSGLGYATDARVQDGVTVAISPIVTVRISGVPFTPATFFGRSFTLPLVSRSQTLEDGMGSVSN